MKRMAFAVTLVGAVALAGTAVAASGAEAVPTFTKDVAPILFNNCVICHRPGEVAPMSLTSYRDARPWSRAIKEKVVSREMPPWYADPRFGEFRNERGLTQQQIDTIVAWVDAGAPQGDEADLPAMPQFAAGWHHPTGAAPDAVIEQPVEFVVPAEGELPNFNIYMPVPFNEDKFLEAVEMMPGNFAVVHHQGAYVRDLPADSIIGRGPAWPGGPVIEDGALVNLGSLSAEELIRLGRDPEELEVERQLSGAAREARSNANVFDVSGTNKMVAYAPGRGFEQFRPGVGKRMPAGKILYFQTHYQATGQVERDRSRLGLWFQNVPVTHEVITQRVGETHIVERAELMAEGGSGGGRGESRARIPNIPPHADDWAITGITAFEDDVTLYAMSPHMHLRGKDTTYVVTYPDGREQVLLSVPKYDFNWQLHYELVEPLKIPAGSTIKTVGHFDNSVRNRWNPAPDKEVYWAEQSWDEMYNGFIYYSIDKLDLTKKKPSTE